MTKTKTRQLTTEEKDFVLKQLERLKEEQKAHEIDLSIYEFRKNVELPRNLEVGLEKLDSFIKKEKAELENCKETINTLNDQLENGVIIKEEKEDTE